VVSNAQFKRFAVKFGSPAVCGGVSPPSLK
jgi:hypothetical protein